MADDRTNSRSKNFKNLKIFKKPQNFKNFKNLKKSKIQKTSKTNKIFKNFKSPKNLKMPQRGLGKSSGPLSICPNVVEGSHLALLANHREGWDVTINIIPHLQHHPLTTHSSPLPTHHHHHHQNSFHISFW